MKEGEGVWSVLAKGGRGSVGCVSEGRGSGEGVRGGEGVWGVLARWRARERRARESEGVWGVFAKWGERGWGARGSEVDVHWTSHGKVWP